MIKIRGVGKHPLRQFGVGVLSLVEGLDDLDSADIFHERGIHGLGDFHRTFILFSVILHHRHHKRHSHGDGDEREESHSPVQNEKINKNADRDQKIGRHFRKQMGQGTLHAFYLIHNNLL